MDVFIGFDGSDGFMGIYTYPQTHQVVYIKYVLLFPGPS